MEDPQVGAPTTARAGFGPAGRALLALTKYVAIAGGLVFVALVAMELVSIVGRKLASAPVPGDVEMLQMCAAFASAAFFAYCHMMRGDVKVDFFTHHLAPRHVALLDALGSLLVAAFGALLAWRTGAGALSLKEDGVTTAVLGWPVWVGQALMVPGFLLLALAGLYMTWHHLREATREPAGRTATGRHRS